MTGETYSYCYEVTYSYCYEVTYPYSYSYIYFYYYVVTYCYSFSYKYSNCNKQIFSLLKKVCQAGKALFLYINISYFHSILYKVVPLITDPPSTSFTTLYKKNISKQAACDMGHVTHDRWREENLLSKFQLPNSYSLGEKGVLKIFLQRMTNSVN